MKVYCKYLFATLAATAMLAGCAKEITPPSFENDKVNPEGSRVIAVSFAPQTKTSYTTTETGGIQPVFANGDEILVANGEDEPETCVVSVDDKTKIATISTNLAGTLKAVYPAKAARMDEQNPKAIGGVLVSTEQDGTFASANICMVKNIPEDAKEVTFQNKTAVFRIIPAAGKNAQYVEVSAEGFEIANDFEDESAYQSGDVIHVAPITADTVYVSTRVPGGLTIGNLKFSDGTNEKAITTGDRAAESIVAGTLYTVDNENWATPEADIPEGAIKGVFSVSTDKQVQFSRGNLRYVVDTQEWGFYEHQYDFCNATTFDGHHSDTVSLFTWGYNATNSVNPIGIDYVFEHDTEGNKQLNPSTGGDDWGVAYCGSNGIDVGTWRTLSTEEWQYLFNYGSYTSEVRNGKYKYGVTVCSKANCVVLLPDNWDGTVISLTDFAAQNTYDESSNPKWSEMEAAGAVCLPAAGYRDGSNVYDVGGRGSYWSSTANGSSRAYIVYFDSGYVNPGSNDSRYYGSSVRLITECQ